MIQFSIIIPFHNAARHDRTAYMHDLLASIPDRKDVEVLLIDDHSSIPFEMPNSKQHAQVMVVNNDSASRYAGTARNKGIDISRGKHLIFADSDDLFISDQLSCVLDAVLQSEAEVHIFHTGSFGVDGTAGSRHENTEKMLSAFQQTGNPDALIRYHGPWGKVLRRDFVIQRQIRFGKTKVANDVTFATQLFLEKPEIQVLPQTAYMIREGHPSLVSEVTKENARLRILVARETQAILTKYGRRDLIIPLHHHLRRYFRSFPLMVVSQAFDALLNRETVFPAPARFIPALQGLIRP